MLKQHQVGILFGLFMRVVGAARFTWTITPLIALLALAAIPLLRATPTIDASTPTSGFVQFLHAAQRGAAPFPYRSAQGAPSNARRAPASDLAANDRPASRRIGDRWLQARPERSSMRTGERAQLGVGERWMRSTVAARGVDPSRAIDLTGVFASLKQADAIEEVDVVSAIDGSNRRVDELAGVASRETVSPLKLSLEQRKISQFVAKSYRIDIDDVQRIVAHAFRAAREFGVDPYLVLAVMSIESSFNPNARSTAGAQGLMQVLTRVHVEKFAPFGGTRAALDPMVNISVGSRILKEYLVREGSVEGALKSYVGAALLSHDFGYGRKVLGERARMVAVAEGRPIPPAPTRRALVATRTVAMAEPGAARALASESTSGSLNSSANAPAQGATAAEGGLLEVPSNAQAASPGRIPVSAPAPGVPTAMPTDASADAAFDATPSPQYTIESIAQLLHGLHEL